MPARFAAQTRNPCPRPRRLNGYLFDSHGSRVRRPMQRAGLRGRQPRGRSRHRQLGRQPRPPPAALARLVVLLCRSVGWRVPGEPYGLGQTNGQGEHRLVVDRYLASLHVGLAEDVEQLLATQPSDLTACCDELSPGEMRLLRQWALCSQGRTRASKQARAAARRDALVAPARTAATRGADGLVRRRAARCVRSLPTAANDRSQPRVAQTDPSGSSWRKAAAW